MIAAGPLRHLVLGIGNTASSRICYTCYVPTTKTVENESDLANPDSLTELLQVPSLRFGCFHCFSFASAFCQATASAFMEGTAVAKLELSGCSFPAGECAAIMASGLARNRSVPYIKVE
jgi:hypothetical protein